MAFDEVLAERVRGALESYQGATEKKTGSDRGCSMPISSRRNSITVLDRAAGLVGCVGCTVLCLSGLVLSSCGGSEVQSTDLPDWCRQMPRPEYADLERIESRDPWFEVYRVAPGVFALYEPHQWEEVISYLITGRERALLFDTGLGIGDIHEVVGGLTTLPVLVLNSHTHPDHVGGNALFEMISGVETDFSETGAGGYREDELREILAPEALCRELPADFDGGSYSIAGFTLDRVVKDEEWIDLGGRRLQVLLTPGHTPDSLMLHDVEAGLLFTGDSFYEGPLYLMSEEADFGTFRESIDRVVERLDRVIHLLTGHNIAVSDRERLRELQSALQAIETGRLEPEILGDGVSEYSFERFRVRVR